MLIPLLVLGPLTDAARAFDKDPAAFGKLKQIVLMGGAYFEVGNITPAAEFNIYVDPEAARIVLASGAPVTMMPLDVTHKALTSRSWVEGMRAMGRIGQAVASWTDFFERYDREKYGSEGAPLHDPCTIAWLIEPGLFAGRHINVEIETKGEYTLGMTVADWWRVSGRPANTNFIRDIDAKGFFDLLTRRLGDLDRRLS